MKAGKLLGVITCSLLVLTGCGASFEVSPSTLETYASENEGTYLDGSSQYTDHEYIEGAYAVEVGDAHVELWDLDTTENASSWFQTNLETLKETATSHAGSDTSKSGDYSFKCSDGKFYRLMFCNDKGIYAYGTKEAVNSALVSMGLIEE